ncbi:interleukin-8 [Denticeps clupeoides]|uniref:Chemokine interleukin-8-like domain-containing protein n=1 Tax=Denticeps clupeoides TaxID=299321 RepID=A0AAY4ERG9_9TELE|nr:interleukin-8-like [Denticeps clupeoides]
MLQREQYLVQRTLSLDLNSSPIHQGFIFHYSSTQKTRMNSKIACSCIVVLLVFLAITEGMSLTGLGVDPRCRCIETESRRIGRLIASVELFPPSPHCKDTEVIATLKGTGQEICLDPSASWVKKVIEKILSQK